MYIYIYKIVVVIFIYFFYCLLKIIFVNIERNKKKNIKVALCTMGKKENLYAGEFMEYYMKLGVDHMFIYDNNDPLSEKIEDVLDTKYKEKISFYQTKNLNITNQIEAFNNCYKNNLKFYDWFIMVDMDEYLYILNNTLKNYLNDEIFDKCHFIKIHYVNSRDNNLLYYDRRPLFERFKQPYIKSKFIKSIIRGNISELEYYVHSPYFSPIKNITCTNDGNIINYTNINFEYINEINTNKSFIIHFKYKSTEEFINKYRRGYSNWHGSKTNIVLYQKVISYLEENEITTEKINYLEKELKINLSCYKERINKTNKSKYKMNNLITNNI